MSYVGYVPATVPFTADQIKPLGDQMYRRMDGANMPLDIFKNGFINGAFDWNQRGLGTYTVGASSATYSSDRWGIFNAGPNGSSSATPASVASTDPIYGSDTFLRVSCTGHSAASDAAYLYQAIENVRRFAGKRCVIRGMARRSSGSGSIAIEIQQNFGSGGSATVFKFAGSFTPSAVWAPFSVVVDVPALTNQVIGSSNFINICFYLSAGSNYNARTNNLGLQTVGVDFAEMEFKEIISGYGDQFPGFERVPRELELIRCQRFYEAGYFNFQGYNAGGNGNAAPYSYKATKRIVPSISYSSYSANNVSTYNFQSGDLNGGFVYCINTSTGGWAWVGQFTASAEF